MMTAVLEGNVSQEEYVSKQSKVYFFVFVLFFSLSFFFIYNQAALISRGE